MVIKAEVIKFIKIKKGRIMKVTFVFILMLSISWQASGAKVRERDLIKESKQHSVEMLIIGVNQGDKIEISKDLAASLKQYDLSESCGINTSDLDRSSRGDKVSAALIPVIATIGKRIIDGIVDKRVSYLKALQKRSTKSYSQTHFISSDELASIRCLVIRRIKNVDTASKDSVGDGVSFTAVLKVEKINSNDKAFYVRPIFVKADDAVVPVLKGSKTLNASIAISLKSIGIKDNGLPVLEEFGSGVLTVPDIVVGDGSKCTSKDKKGVCNASGMLPISNLAAPVSITLAVTEAGQLGIDFDVRIAELEALKEAYGTAVFDGITAVLE
jgi:hypothetical protein